MMRIPVSPSPRTVPPVTIYFDGVCSLCNGFVDFLVRRDGARRFRYASLQGSSFAALRERHPEALANHRLETMVAVIPDPVHGWETVCTRSDAVLASLGELPGLWRRFSALFRLVPRPIRDVFYDLVARNRYRIWGRKATCRMPTAEERGLFLE